MTIGSFRSETVKYREGTNVVMFFTFGTLSFDEGYVEHYNTSVHDNSIYGSRKCRKGACSTTRVVATSKEFYEVRSIILYSASGGLTLSLIYKICSRFSISILYYVVFPLLLLVLFSSHSWFFIVLDWKICLGFEWCN